MTGTAATNRLDATLHGRFLRGLAIAPDRPAFRVGGREVSYAQAHETALTWAGTLLGELSAPPATVGVFANKSAEAYLGTLAALYTGAAVVPLHPDFPDARNRYALTAAGVGAVITDERGAGAAAELLPEGAAILTPDGAGGGRVLRPRPELALTAPRPADPDDPAYILFTSGSTGVPKGVRIRHSSNRHYFSIIDDRYDFGPDDVFSQTFDLTFDCAMFDLFSAWGSGACVLPVPLRGLRTLPAFAAEHGLTVWFSAPSAIDVVRRTGGLASGALAGLRYSFFAGEPLRCVDADEWQRAAPDAAVENLYGPTELTITVSGHRWSEASTQRSANGIVPIGPVHPGHDHLLLGPDDRPVDTDGPDPVEGELCVTGPQMCAGYLDPAENAGRFADHDGRTYYRTGDRVRHFPDGELTYLGRADDQVQISGLRVELSEITHAVRTCPGVTDAAAVAPVVDGEPRLFVFHTGEPLTAATITRHLRDTLPAGMLPRHYQHLGEMPLNPNRKTDRKALKERAAALLAVPAGGGAGSGSAPMTPDAEAGTGRVDQPARYLHDILDTAAATWPDSTAISDATGAWTYAEVARLSHATAGWLRGQGVRRGDRVLVQLPNMRHAAPLWFALSRLGAVFVPLNPGMKDFHLRSVITDSEPVLALVAAPAGDRFGAVPAVQIADCWAAVQSADATPVGSADVQPDDPVAFMYTSGSTAAPKAVVLPQAPVAFAAAGIQAMLGYRPDDVVFCRSPLSFDYGLYQILLATLAGAELALAADEPEVRLLRQLRQTGATVFPAVPSLATALVKLLARDPGPTSLRMVTNTGAALPQAVIDGLRASLPGAQVVRMYGTTECKRISIMPPYEEFDRPGSVGRPLPGTRVRILDADGAELPPGEVGEIVVTGPHVMAGYWKLPELTARTFRLHPDGEVRLHTGDYGNVDADGYLYFSGRRDDMFKRKGTRMSSIEIEAAAMDVPGVRAAAVLPPTDTRDLTIFVAADLPPTTVLRELAVRLEPAKVPAVCRVLAEFPLTLNGKSAKQQLTAMVEAETR
ncbi:AMP-binding protein [Micromonospora sp. CPCC 206060]|uniref:AMP-binding protein n=1 Tax=Micromonospora sp. CPCC 206060 TaxID=3122406 RepID=UPI002FEF7A1F